MQPLYEYTMTYISPACRCGSKMVHHTRTEKAWLFRCWVCFAAIDREKIQELDAEFYLQIGESKDE